MKEENKRPISISALKLFQTCPQKYYLKYIQKEPEITIGSALIFGKAVHSTMEEFSISEGSISPAQFFRTTYDTFLLEARDNGKIVDYGDWDSYEEDIMRGMDIVEKFLSRTDSYLRGKIHCEVPFAVDIPGIDKYYLSGFMDGIVPPSKGGTELLEYKTTKAPPADFFINYDIQLIGYLFALKYGRPIVSYANPETDEKLKHLFGSDAQCAKYIALHSQYKGKKRWHVNKLYYICEPSKKKYEYFIDTVTGLCKNIDWCTENGIWTKYLKDPSTSPCNNCSYKTICWGSGNIIQPTNLFSDHDTNVTQESPKATYPRRINLVRNKK